MSNYVWVCVKMVVIFKCNTFVLPHESWKVYTSITSWWLFSNTFLWYTEAKKKRNKNSLTAQILSCTLLIYFNNFMRLQTTTCMVFSDIQIPVSSGNTCAVVKFFKFAFLYPQVQLKKKKHKKNYGTAKNTHPHAKLRIFQPHRSWTALGYMVDSLEVFVTPQKNNPPAKTIFFCTVYQVKKHANCRIHNTLLLWFHIYLVTSMYSVGMSVTKIVIICKY